MKHVDGVNKGKLLLYALSTCIWCKKTRALLEQLSVEYDYEYVDLLEGDAKTKALSEVKKWNPSASFPVLVVNGEKAINGFSEDEIKEEFS
jgi:glutaredoxin